LIDRADSSRKSSNPSPKQPLVDLGSPTYSIQPDPFRIAFEVSLEKSLPRNVNPINY